jgi:hypothetical protein
VASVIEDILEGAYDTLTSVPVGRKLIGERFVGTHLEPNTVIAVPLGAPQIDPTNQPGEQEQTDDVGTFRARRLYTRWFNVRFVVCDTDFETCEGLYLDLLKAIRKTYHNGVRFSGETWIDQGEGADGFYANGRVIEFQTTFEIPVWDKKKYLTTVTGITTNCTEAP